MRTHGIAALLCLFVAGLTSGCTNSTKQSPHAIQICTGESPPCTVAAMKKVEHPEVDSGLECLDCHADEAKMWLESQHGLNNVKCSVCHGDIQSNFMAPPPVDRCIGCHADAVASMKTERMSEKTCFSCHTGHSLTPHHLASGGDR